MAIVRHDRRPSFLIIDKRTVEDRRLSFKARGLLVELMAKPDGWRVSVQDLIKRSPGGRGVVESALDELERFGYITRGSGRRDDAGRFDGTDVEVREQPAGGWAEPLRKISNGDRCGKTARGKTARGKSATRENTGSEYTDPVKTHLSCAGEADAGGSSLRSEIIAACGLNDSILTRSSLGALTRAVHELQAVDADPEQVTQAARAFRARFPSASLTPSALAKHWPSLVTAPSTGPPTPPTYAERIGISLGRTGTPPDEARAQIDDEIDEPDARDEAWSAYERARPQVAG